MPVLICRDTFYYLTEFIRICHLQSQRSLEGLKKLKLLSLMTTYSEKQEYRIQSSRKFYHRQSKGT